MLVIVVISISMQHVFAFAPMGHFPHHRLFHNNRGRISPLPPLDDDSALLRRQVKLVYHVYKAEDKMADSPAFFALRAMKKRQLQQEHSQENDAYAHSVGMNNQGNRSQD